MSKKPNGYWTKERLMSESKKYKNRAEFKEKSSAAYSISKKKSYWRDICAHMEPSPRPKAKSKWSKSAVHKEALRYKTRWEFEKNSSRAYRAAKYHGWLNEVRSHMEFKTKPSGYWTKGRIIDEVNKYKTKKDFREKSPNAHDSANRLGIFKEVTSHLSSPRKSDGYWSKQKCTETVSGYDNFMDFRKECGSAYAKIMYMGWGDLMSHLKRCNSDTELKRHVYVYIFNDDSAYIGLTWNTDKRQGSHIKDEKSPVFQHIKNKCSKYIYKILTKNPASEDKAKELEYFYEDKYKNDGFNILNVAKTGSLGGNAIKWTRENCLIESKKYSLKSEFRKKANGAYGACSKKGWLSDACAHMVKKFPLSKDICRVEADKFKDRSSFNKGSNTAYRTSLRNSWLDEFFPHANSCPATTCQNANHAKIN